MGQSADKVIMSWEKAFPLATNRFFIYDVLKVLLWTAAIMMLLLTITFALVGNLGSLWGIFPVLGIILAALFILILLIALVIFGNRYPARFTLTDRNIHWSGRSRIGRRANALAIVAGALARKPVVAGSGLIAAAGEDGGMSWKKVARIKEYPAERVITVMNGWRVVVRLYCTPENYQAAAETVRRLASLPGKKS